MNSYLLSVDPSIKNTGFTLWEHIYKHCKCFGNCNCNNINVWKPILIKSYSFKNYNNKNEIDKFKVFLGNDKWDLIIERGTFYSKNGIGYETQEHLRGFIAGQFNKLLTKDMLVSPSQWQKWYLKDIKWNKENALYIANNLIKKNNWNVIINNHDEADSLLIGWYYINKENN